jgi:hypothetical protein
VSAAARRTDGARTHGWALGAALGVALGAGCSSGGAEQDHAQQLALVPTYAGPVGHAANDLWLYSPFAALDLQHYDGTRWQRVFVGGLSVMPGADFGGALSAGPGALWLAFNGPPALVRVYADGHAEDHTAELALASPYARVTVGGTEAAPIVTVSDYGTLSGLRRWDGTRLITVPPPTSAGEPFVVIDALAFATTDFWLGGQYGSPVMYHFDGTTWSNQGRVPAGPAGWTASDPQHFWNVASDASRPQSLHILHYAGGQFTTITALAPVADVAGFRGYRTLGAFGLPGDRVVIVGTVAYEAGGMLAQDAVYFTYAPGGEVSPRRTLFRRVEQVPVTDGGQGLVAQPSLLAPLGDGTLALGVTTAMSASAYLARPGDL